MEYAHTYKFGFKLLLLQFPFSYLPKKQKTKIGTKSNLFEWCHYWFKYFHFCDYFFSIVHFVYYKFPPKTIEINEKNTSSTESLLYAYYSLVSTYSLTHKRLFVRVDLKKFITRRIVSTKNYLKFLFSGWNEW